MVAIKVIIKVTDILPPSQVEDCFETRSEGGRMVRVEFQQRDEDLAWSCLGVWVDNYSQKLADDHTQWNICIYYEHIYNPDNCTPKMLYVAWCRLPSAKKGWFQVTNLVGAWVDVLPRELYSYRSRARKTLEKVKMQVCCTIIRWNLWRYSLKPKGLRLESLYFGGAALHIRQPRSRSSDLQSSWGSMDWKP